LNLIGDDKVFGFQVRDLTNRRKEKYKTMSLSNLHKALQDGIDVPDTVNSLSTVFNIFNINVYRPVLVTEGPFDAFLLPNCIAMSGANKSISVELPFWYVYDSDKTGNEQALRARLADIDIQNQRLNAQLDEIKKRKTEAETFIRIADPDGKIQDQYQSIYDQIKAINGSIDSKQSIFDKYKNQLETYLESDMYDKELLRISKLQAQYQGNVDNLQSKISDLVSKRENLIKQIDVDRNKLENLKNGFEIENLRKSVEILRNQRKSLQSNLEDSQSISQTISRAEFETIQANLVQIKESIVTFYSKHFENDITYACENFLSGVSTDETLNKYKITQDEMIKEKALVDSASNLIVQYNAQMSEIAVLKDRPKKCTINNCPFIEHAIQLQKSGVDKLLKEAETTKAEHEERIANLEKLSNDLRNVHDAMVSLESITSTINAGRILLDKLPVSVIFTDETELYNRISRLDNFSELDNLSRYSDAIDAQEEIKVINNKLTVLEADLKVAEVQEDNILNLERTIESEAKEIETLNEDIGKTKQDVVFNKDLNDTYIRIVSELTEMIDANKELEQLKSNKDKLVADYRLIESNIKQIKTYIDQINNIDSDLAKVQADINPLQAEKDGITYSLNSIIQYTQELAEYQDKYNIVNTLKKYSSPTTGIQTVFMNMYLSKTLTTANEILGLMFEGHYKLLPYVINENEFRLPFVGNGLPVDDVSRGSNSQKCIIGTIINLVLLFQASTKYRIAELDEVDESLDYQNRTEYINVLYQLINLLGIDQLIMISHNVMESDFSNLDIIRLQNYDSNEQQSGNIIFDYNDYISEGGNK
jgi:DNA repair exonuclease SbcCD ATPase subunit